MACIQRALVTIINAAEPSPTTWARSPRSSRCARAAHPRHELSTSRSATIRAQANKLAVLSTKSRTTCRNPLLSKPFIIGDAARMTAFLLPPVPQAHHPPAVPPSSRRQTRQPGLGLIGIGRVARRAADSSKAARSAPLVLQIVSRPTNGTRPTTSPFHGRAVRRSVASALASVRADRGRPGADRRAAPFVNQIGRSLARRLEFHASIELVGEQSHEQFGTATSMFIATYDTTTDPGDNFQLPARTRATAWPPIPVPARVPGFTSEVIQRRGAGAARDVRRSDHP